MPAYPCPQCGGRRRVIILEVVETTGGGTHVIKKEITCPTCEGKGWI